MPELNYEQLSATINNFLAANVAITTPQNVYTERPHPMGVEHVNLGYDQSGPKTPLDQFIVFQKDAKNQFQPIPLDKWAENLNPRPDKEAFAEKLSTLLKNGQVAVSQYGRTNPARLQMNAEGTSLALKGLEFNRYVDDPKPKLTFGQRIKRFFGKLPAAEAAVHENNKIEYAMAQYSERHSRIVDNLPNAQSDTLSHKGRMADGMGFLNTVTPSDSVRMPAIIEEINKRNQLPETQRLNAEADAAKLYRAEASAEPNKELVRPSGDVFNKKDFEKALREVRKGVDMLDGTAKLSPTQPPLAAAIRERLDNISEMQMLKVMLEPNAAEMKPANLANMVGTALLQGMGHPQYDKAGTKEIIRPEFKERLEDLMRTTAFKSTINVSKDALLKTVTNGTLFDTYLKNVTNASSFEKPSLSEKEIVNALTCCRNPAEISKKQVALSQAIKKNEPEAAKAGKPENSKQVNEPKPQPKPQPKAPSK